MKYFSLILILVLSFCKGGQKMNHSHEHHNGHGKANETIDSAELEKLIARFDDPDREKWQKPNKVIQLFGDIKNKTIADVGAGTGYFTFRLAKSAKKVIASEPTPKLHEYLVSKQKSSPKEISSKIEIRLSEYHDSKLKKDEVDGILTVNTYHHIENRIDYFKNLLNLLKSNGQIIVIDFKNGDFPVGPPVDHKLDEAIVFEEMSKIGCKSIKKDSTTLEYQYVLICQK